MPVDKLMHVAQGLLARREHAKVELQQKLITKGFSQEQVDKVITLLEAKGLQSDERYASALIRSRINKGYGPNYIKRYLSEKGISEEIFWDMLSSVEWSEKAMSLWQRKFKQFSRDGTVLAKQKRFLFYRGFDSKTIALVFKQLEETNIE